MFTLQTGFRKFSKLLYFVLIILLIISVSVSAAGLADKAIQKIVCGSQLAVLCQVYGYVLNPTDAALNAMPNNVRLTYFGIVASPSEALLQEAKGKVIAEVSKNPDAAKAIEMAKRLDGYIKEINAGKDPDKQGYTSAYDKEGTLIIKDKTGKIFASIPKGWELAPSQEGGFNLINNKPKKDQKPLIIGNYKIEGTTDKTKIIYNQPKADEEAFLDVNSEKPSKVTIGGKIYYIDKGPNQFRELNNQIVSANFISSQKATYIFAYPPGKKSDLQKTYEFEADKGTKIIFDPKSGNIEGQKGNLKITDVTGEKLLRGNFNVIVNKDGSIKQMNLKANSFFNDNEDLIQATSDKDFTVCLSGHSDDTDLVNVKDGCDGKNLFRLNKNKVNQIVSKGKIRYNVGFAEINSLEDGTVTTYAQSPTLNDYFQIRSGSVDLIKDGIIAHVKYVPCPKGVGKVVKDIFSTKKALEINCGTLTNIDKTGFTLINSQFVTIVDKDGKYSVEIGPNGGIIAVSDKGSLTVRKGYESSDYERNLFAETTALFGAPAVRKEHASVVLADTFIENLDTYIGGLNCEGKIGKAMCILDEVPDVRTLVGARKKSDLKLLAEVELKEEKRALDQFKDFITQGFSVEDAAKKSGLNPIVASIFTKGFNDDGSINVDNMFDIANDINNRIVSKGVGDYNVYTGLGFLTEKTTITRFLTQDLYDKEIPNLGSITQDLDGKPSLFTLMADPKGRVSPYIAPAIIKKVTMLPPDVYSLPLDETIIILKDRVRQIENFGLYMPLSGNKQINKGNVHLLKKEIERLEKIQAANPDLNKLDKYKKSLKGPEAIAKVTEFTYGLVTVADVIPIGKVAKAGAKLVEVAKAGKFVTKGGRIVEFTRAGLLNELKGGFGDLKGYVRVRPLFLKSQGKNALEDIPLIPKIAEGCI